MGEMKIDLWLFFSENLSMISDWLFYAIGIIFSILQFKNKPQKSALTLFTFVTFLLLSIVNLIVFFGAFYSLLRQGYNREIFDWGTDILTVMAQAALLFVLFSKETKTQASKKS